MAEWSNAPDSKSGVQVYLYRGFESLSFRQYKDLKPAQQAKRQPQAPHLAGLFALGS